MAARQRRALAEGRSLIAGGPAAPRLPALDGLRGLAALLIAAYHAWLLSGEAALGGGPWRDALSSGHLAVSLFFVLSGLVLLWPAARDGSVGDPLGFLVRRAARLLPAFYASLAIGVLASGLLVSGDLRVTVGSAVAHLLAVQNEARLLPGYEGALGFGVNPVLWTITVELTGSVLLLVLAPWFLRRPWACAAVALAFAAGVRLLLPGLGLDARTDALLLSSTPVHFADFACGMAAAVLLARPPAWLRDRAAVLTVVSGTALTLVLVLAGGPDGSVVRSATRADALTTVLVPVLFAVLCVGVAVRPPAVLRSRVAVWLGSVSYGVFLGHFLVIGFARTTLDLPVDGSLRAFLAMEAVVLAGAVGYGVLSWTLLERPAQRRARAFSSGRRRRSSPSAPPDASPARAAG